MLGKAVEFVLDVADELFENVFLRNHANDQARFAADESQMQMIGNHPPQGFTERHVFGQANDLPNDLADNRVSRMRLGQQHHILERDISDDRLRIAAPQSDGKRVCKSMWAMTRFSLSGASASTITMSSSGIMMSATFIVESRLACSMIRSSCMPITWLARSMFT